MISSLISAVHSACTVLSEVTKQATSVLMYLELDTSDLLLIMDARSA